MYLCDRKGTCCECCFLAAVAIGKRGPGPVRGCSVIFTWPIKSMLLSLVHILICIHVVIHIAYRLVHGFTCAGVLPTQYINFARSVGLGRMGHAYIRQGNCCMYACLL